jgi:HTH-type transcriptional regulator/antitoxin HigA
MTERIPAEVFPPGDLVREELEARGWTQTDLAEILGRPLRVVNEILSGRKAITPETAQGLGEAFGVGAQFWLNMESSYRLHVYRGKSNTAKMVSRKAALYEKAPIKDMMKRRWIEPSESIDVLEKQVDTFFAERTLAAAARKSTPYDETTNAQRAWLYRVKHLAAAIDAGKYSKQKLLSGLGDLKALMAEPEEVRHVPRLLSDLGVRFLIVEHLPHTKIDGACVWLKSSPVVVLSMRYDRIDSFWFTLAHELGHVVNKDQFSIDIDLVTEKDAQDKPPQETRADHFAAQLLVPQEELDDFIARVDPLYSKNKIKGFAARIGVHPGIVVGQLHNRDKISYSHSREMLVKVRSLVLESSLTDGWGQIAPNLIRKRM